MSKTMKDMLPSLKEESYTYEDWTINVKKSHIMGSKCQDPSNCTTVQQSSLCMFCRYEKTLKLPSLPDMIFADNKLTISHRDGGSIEFNAYDALQCVDDKPEESIEVAHAKVWKEARADCQFANKPTKNYDWTYTTKYRGTLNAPIVCQPTSDRIDLDKLRVKEEIKFYDEIYLYEDELDDNGCTKCTIKVRVMPSGFFIVFRHYLRVDHVLIRVNDTRLYHPQGSSYILRESSKRQQEMSALNIHPTIYKNPDMVWQHLPLIEETIDKLAIEPI